MERIADIVERKRRIGAMYAGRLRDMAGLSLQVVRPWARPNYWMFGIVLDDAVPLNAREFGARLAGLGIETRPFFLGMHEQPALLRRGLFKGERHPVTERLSRRGLYLPSGAGLTADQCARVADAVRATLAAA
jgi:perosamine synthetase